MSEVYPIPVPRHLRIVGDEDVPSYDGKPIRPPFVMTDQETGSTILATLGGACFGIYWTLQRHADKSGTCWPSLDTIADANHLSRMHVTRCLAKLEATGWITRSKRATMRGLSTSTLYTVFSSPSTDGCNTRRTSDEHASVVDVTRTRPKLDENQTPPLPPRGETDALTYGEDFLAFWAVYPSKTGKGAAYKAWQKLRPSKALQSQMIDAVTSQRSSVKWTKDGGQYIPNPATWINAGGWDDETTMSAPVKSVLKPFSMGFG